MMTTPATETGLLQAIIDDPTSDDPRLIFADWLEENGQEARAEFIRVQCSLAEREHTRMAGDGATRWHQETQALRRRERELLKYHHWACGNYSTAITAGYHALDRPIYKLFPPGGGTEIANVTFSRGFVAEIICTLEVWMGRECDRCDGGRFVEHNPTPGILCLCIYCHGTGRVGGHGPALVKAAPLERVTLTDNQENILWRSYTLLAWARSQND